MIIYYEVIDIIVSRSVIVLVMILFCDYRVVRL